MKPVDVVSRIAAAATVVFSLLAAGAEQAPSDGPERFAQALDRYDRAVQDRVDSASDDVDLALQRAVRNLQNERAALLDYLKTRSDAKDRKSFETAVRSHVDAGATLVDSAEEVRLLLNDYSARYAVIRTRTPASIDQGWKLFGRVLAHESLVTLNRQIEELGSSLALMVVNDRNTESSAVATVASNEDAIAMTLNENVRGFTKLQGSEWVAAMRDDLTYLFSTRVALAQAQSGRRTAADKFALTRTQLKVPTVVEVVVDPAQAEPDQRVAVRACVRRAVCDVGTTPFNRSSPHQRTARRHRTAHGCIARIGQLHPMDSCRRSATAARRHRAASHRHPHPARPQRRFGSARRGRRRRVRTDPRPEGSASAGHCVQLDGTGSCGEAADRHRVSTPARTAVEGQGGATRARRHRRTNLSAESPAAVHAAEPHARPGRKNQCQHRGLPASYRQLFEHRSVDGPDIRRSGLEADVGSASGHSARVRIHRAIGRPRVHRGDRSAAQRRGNSDGGSATFPRVRQAAGGGPSVRAERKRRCESLSRTRPHRRSVAAHRRRGPVARIVAGRSSVDRFLIGTARRSFGEVRGRTGPVRGVRERRIRTGP